MINTVEDAVKTELKQQERSVTMDVVSKILDYQLDLYRRIEEAEQRIKILEDVIIDGPNPLSSSET